MATWSEFESAAPPLAAAIKGRIEHHLHHVLGTLRLDGSPRLSGTEVRFHDGEMWLGCMPGSVKAKDLRRDPRYAIHSAPTDPDMVDGDAKLSGTVTEVSDPERVKAFLIAIGHGGERGDPDPATALAFTCDIGAATLTRVAVDHLEVTTWTPARGLVTNDVR